MNARPEIEVRRADLLKRGDACWNALQEHIVTVDARKVSAAEFVRALKPQPSRLKVLCGQLWNADREEVRRIHAEIAQLTDVTRDTCPKTGNERVGG